LATSFELFLLDQRAIPGVIVLARCGADTAIEHLPTDDAKLAALAAFGREIGKAVTGNAAQRPLAEDLNKFGSNLFKFLFRDSLLVLYNHLPPGPVSIQILTDLPAIREIPWEYLVTPDRQPSPHRERSIIRVQPTCGIYSPARTKGRKKKIKVLFVASDPTDQQSVTCRDVVTCIDRAFKGQESGATIKVIPAATCKDLDDAIIRENFNVFHFLGHGTLINGIGHLVLEDIETRNSSYFSAAELAVALAGKGVQLAILSACLSSGGKLSDDFGVIATALIQTGIPAVVANQYPIPFESISPFVSKIYTSLAKNGDIDLAVAEGRVTLSRGLSSTTGGRAVVEWGIPTLYRLPDARQLFLL
jgi:hypothetical protein